MWKDRRTEFDMKRDVLVRDFNLLHLHLAQMAPQAICSEHHQKVLSQLIVRFEVLEQEGKGEA